MKSVKRKVNSVIGHFMTIFLIFHFSLFTFSLMKRDVAQPGSVLRSGRRGRWFESSHPDLNGLKGHL